MDQLVQFPVEAIECGGIMKTGSGPVVMSGPVAGQADDSQSAGSTRVVGSALSNDPCSQADSFSRPAREHVTVGFDQIDDRPFVVRLGEQPQLFHDFPEGRELARDDMALCAEDVTPEYGLTFKFLALNELEGPERQSAAFVLDAAMYAQTQRVEFGCCSRPDAGLRHGEYVQISGGSLLRARIVEYQPTELTTDVVEDRDSADRSGS